MAAGIVACSLVIAAGVCGIDGPLGFGRETGREARERGEREREKTGNEPFPPLASPHTKLCCGYVIKSEMAAGIVVCLLLIAAGVCGVGQVGACVRGWGVGQVGSSPEISLIPRHPPAGIVVCSLVIAAGVCGVGQVGATLIISEVTTPPSSAYPPKQSVQQP